MPGNYVKIKSVATNKYKLQILQGITDVNKSKKIQLYKKVYLTFMPVYCRKIEISF